MPATAHMLPARSPIGSPSLVGGPSRSPLTLMAPLNAWTTVSTEALPARLPSCPKPLSEQRMMSGLLWLKVW